MDTSVSVPMRVPTTNAKSYSPPKNVQFVKVNSADLSSQMATIDPRNPALQAVIVVVKVGIDSLSLPVVVEMTSTEVVNAEVGVAIIAVVVFGAVVIVEVEVPPQQ